MNLLRRLTLRQLQIFTQVAQEQSIVRAAEKLHLSQPAVSMQIRQLEEATEQILFERSRSGLSLTHAGSIMLQHAHRVLGEVKDAQESLSALTQLDAGSLTLGLVSTSKYFCFQLISQFKEKYPNIDVNVVQGNRKKLLRHLRDNSIDLALMGRPPKDLEAIAEPLANNPHLLIAPANHPLRKGQKLDFHELRNDVFLIREAGSGTRKVSQRIFEQHLFQPSQSITLNSLAAIKQGIMAGLGVSLLSLHCLELELSLDRVCILDIDGLPTDRVWHLVHMQRKHLSPSAQAFRTFMLENTAPAIQKQFNHLWHKKRGRLKVSGG